MKENGCSELFTLGYVIDGGSKDYTEMGAIPLRRKEFLRVLGFCRQSKTNFHHDPELMSQYLIHGGLVVFPYEADKPDF